MSDNAGAAERLLQRMTKLLAQVCAFELSLRVERAELRAQLRKHEQDIPEHEK